MGFTPRPSQALPPPPTLSHESPERSDGWKTIGKQEEFYDERDFLYPSRSLISEKLKNRNEDDVVIFDYLLNGADGNPGVEGGGLSSRSFSEEDNMFFLMPKDRLIGSKQFTRIINPTKEAQLIRSGGPRLAIM